MTINRNISLRAMDDSAMSASLATCMVGIKNYSNVKLSNIVYLQIFRSTTLMRLNSVRFLSDGPCRFHDIALPIFRH